MVDEIQSVAEKMARDQREISVSEFFERNRHLLGYDNPTRSLITVVKELVDNSLTWGTPLVIRRNGRIEEGGI